MTALVNGNNDTANYLIDAGADLRKIDTNSLLNLTPLHFAAMACIPGLIDKICKKEPSLINTLDKNKRTPLHILYLWKIRLLDYPIERTKFPYKYIVIDNEKRTAKNERMAPLNEYFERTYDKKINPEIINGAIEECIKLLEKTYSAKQDIKDKDNRTILDLKEEIRVKEKMFRVEKNAAPFREGPRARPNMSRPASSNNPVNEMTPTFVGPNNNAARNKNGTWVGTHNTTEEARLAKEAARDAKIQFLAAKMKELRNTKSVAEEEANRVEARIAGAGEAAGNAFLANVNRVAGRNGLNIDRIKMGARPLYKPTKPLSSSGNSIPKKIGNLSSGSAGAGAGAPSAPPEDNPTPFGRGGRRRKTRRNRNRRRSTRRRARTRRS